MAMVMIAFSGLIAQSVTYIPRIGINSSNIDANVGDLAFEGKQGWNLGLDTRFGTGMIWFSPGFHFYKTSLYVESVDLTDPLNRFTEEPDINSIKVPVNIGINLTKPGGILHLYGKAGVVGNVNFSFANTGDLDLRREDVRTFGAAANVGVGIDLLFFNIEANYEFGLTDYFELSSGKNNVLTLGLGIKI